MNAEDLPLDEVGYGAEPLEMTPLAAGAAAELARRGRVPADATLWCPECRRALLTVHRINGRFLAVPRGKGVPADERGDDAPLNYMGTAMPFILGETWSTVPLTCRCGLGAGRALLLDVRVFVAALNSSPRRDFVAVADPLGQIRL